MSSKLQAPNKQEMSLSIPAYTHNPIFILKNCFGHSPYIRPSNVLGAGIVAKLHPTLCDAVNCSTPGSPVLHCLLEFAQGHVHCVGDAIQPSYPLSPLLFLPSVFPSIRVFSNESALHIRKTKYWSFTFSISPSNEYSGLISFRTDWFDLLVVQGILKSLLQHHNLKASILRCPAFFMVQLKKYSYFLMFLWCRCLCEYH